MAEIAQARPTPVQQVAVKSFAIRQVPSFPRIAKIDTSTFRLHKGVNVFSNVSPRVNIDPEVKAGGSFKTNFVVEMTRTGIQVDVTS